MTGADNDCQEEGCRGTVDFQKGVLLRTGCATSELAYACQECGRLYFIKQGELKPAFTKRDAPVYLGREFEEPIRREGGPIGR